MGCTQGCGCPSSKERLRRIATRNRVVTLSHAIHTCTIGESDSGTYSFSIYYSSMNNTATTLHQTLDFLRFMTFVTPSPSSDVPCEYVSNENCPLRSFQRFKYEMGYRRKDPKYVQGPRETVSRSQHW